MRMNYHHKNWIFVFFLFGLFLTACDLESLDPNKKKEEEEEINKPPVILSLTASQYIVDPMESIVITVDATDEQSEALSYSWQATLGSILPPTDSPQVSWKAPSNGGNVTISCTVSDGETSVSRSLNITVRAYEAPNVNILYPPNNACYVAGDTVHIKVYANHSNGIEAVRLMLNQDLLTSTSSCQNSVFSFVHTLGESYGILTLTAQAVAKITGTTGNDSIQLEIQGIIPGKILP